MSERKTQKQFLQDAYNVHGDKYDYTDAVYINSATNVLIKCNTCGTKFLQTPNSHTSRGSGCPICARERTKKFLIPIQKLGKEEFARRAREVHGDMYDYTKSEYVGYEDKLCITCKKHGDFWQRPGDHLHGQGCPKCGREKLCNESIGVSKSKKGKVFGVGINDYNGVVCTLKKTSASYNHWKLMLERCYNNKYSWYKDCSVCEDWLSYSNFKRWFEDPVNGYKDGYCLDKDILIKNNKVYSPQTCCFVPPFINTLFVKRKALRGKYPIGVTKRGNGKYLVQMQRYGKLQRLGLYITKDEAFYVYKKTKESYIKEVAKQFYNEGKITKNVYDALMRYEVEITD